MKRKLTQPFMEQPGFVKWVSQYPDREKATNGSIHSRKPPGKTCAYLNRIQHDKCYVRRMRAVSRCSQTYVPLKVPRYWYAQRHILPQLNRSKKPCCCVHEMWVQMTLLLYWGNSRGCRMSPLLSYGRLHQERHRNRMEWLVSSSRVGVGSKLEVMLV